MRLREIKHDLKEIRGGIRDNKSWEARRTEGAIGSRETYNPDSHGDVFLYHISDSSLNSLVR